MDNGNSMLNRAIIGIVALFTVATVLGSAGIDVPGVNATRTTSRRYNPTPTIIYSPTPTYYRSGNEDAREYCNELGPGWRLRKIYEDPTWGKCVWIGE